jgi:diguanylate cyclase (GGDEF)-like protein
VWRRIATPAWPPISAGLSVGAGMLHHPTLLLVQASVALLTTALIVVAALGVGRRVELKWWAAGNVVATSGLLLVAQSQWPLIVHAVIGYGVIGLGLAMVWRGLRTFCGSDLPTPTMLGVPAAALAVALAYTFVWPSLESRLVASSLGFGALNLACAATLVFGVRHASRPVMWVSAAGFAALGLALLVRAVAHLGIGSDPPLQRLISSLTVYVTALAQITIAFGLILMVARQYAEELRQASLTDRLTGALNRAGLEYQMQRLLRRAERSGHSLAVLMLDVDHFKQINDTHGHPAGDLVLQALVRLLREQVRPGDVVARYGGEEFLIVLDGQDPGSALVVAERVREAIAATPVAAGTVTIRLTASIGVATVAEAGYDLDALVRSADAAVYRAKAEGRNRVVASQRQQAEARSTA